MQAAFAGVGHEIALIHATSLPDDMDTSPAQDLAKAANDPDSSSPMLARPRRSKAGFIGKTADTGLMQVQPRRIPLRLFRRKRTRRPDEASLFLSPACTHAAGRMPVVAGAVAHCQLVHQDAFAFVLLGKK